MAKLSSEQKAELKKLFDSYDTDKNASVTAAELKAAFQKMGFTLSPMEIANIIGKADTDGSGTIEFDEFCASNLQAANEALFKKYDKNGDGFLGAEEIVPMAKELGYTNLTVAQAKNLIDSVDTNKDGKLSFDEFKKLSSK